jgi:hypothetical protein
MTATSLDAAPARRPLTGLLRIEDLVMVGWVAAVSPLLFRVGADKGPFDAGQPVAGILRLVAVLGVLVCLAARKAPDPTGKAQPGLINRGVIGPFSGGLLLVTISGFVGLGTSSQLVLAVVVAAGLAMIAVRVAVPPLDLRARRALVAPFATIAGGLYWSFIEMVLPNQQAAQVRHAALVDPHAATPVLLFLLAFSVVYYAMLIYAPRQIAEREGGRAEWVVRYLAFVASIALGVGWLSIISG